MKCRNVDHWGEVRTQGPEGIGKKEGYRYR